MSAVINLDYEKSLFELEQRKAMAMIKGSILPARFKNVGDVMILNEMSRNLQVPTIMLAQQLYVVKGTPAMSGQLSIALLNNAKRFDTVMKWEEEFTPKWRIRAYNSINGDVIYGEWLDDEMIQANGWLTNSKWQTMKSQMARYRTASWFGRLYAPDVFLGFMEVNEVIDAEIVEDEKDNDLNQMILQKEDINLVTGEVTKVSKPDMSSLDRINADGTCNDEMGE